MDFHDAMLEVEEQQDERRWFQCFECARCLEELACQQERGELMRPLVERLLDEVQLGWEQEWAKAK